MSDFNHRRKNKRHHKAYCQVYGCLVLSRKNLSSDSVHIIIHVDGLDYSNSAKNECVKNMNIGDIVVLKGRTQKGKNRIREHGESFTLLRRSNKVPFSSNLGDWCLFESRDGKHYLVWVDVSSPDREDFVL